MKLSSPFKGTGSVTSQLHFSKALWEPGLAANNKQLIGFIIYEQVANSLYKFFPSLSQICRENPIAHHMERLLISSNVPYLRMVGALAFSLQKVSQRLLMVRSSHFLGQIVQKWKWQQKRTRVGNGGKRVSNDCFQ